MFCVAVRSIAGMEIESFWSSNSLILICPDIGLLTRQLSCLLSTAIPCRSMSLRKQSLFVSPFRVPILTEMVLDVAIVFSLCIAEQTCGALTVCIILSFALDRMNLTFTSSTRIRSWSFPGWQNAQISNPKSLYILSFQRRTSHLSWTTGTHILPSHQSFGKLIPFVLFFSLLYMKQPSSSFAYCNSLLDLF